MEYKIGEILTLSPEYDRIKVKVVEGRDDCRGCVFETFEGLGCLGYCNGKTRTDNKKIIYKEITEE